MKLKLKLISTKEKELLTISKTKKEKTYPVKRDQKSLSAIGGLEQYGEVIYVRPECSEKLVGWVVEEGWKGTGIPGRNIGRVDLRGRNTHASPS